MTERDDERIELAPEERAFVRRVAELSAPPQPSAARRAAFAAGVERRRARRTRMRVQVGSGAALAAAALVAWLAVALPHTSPEPQTAGPPAVVPVASPTRATRAALTPEETLLQLANDTDPDSDEGLPADYAAIQSLFLGS